MDLSKLNVLASIAELIEATDEKVRADKKQLSPTFEQTMTEAGDYTAEAERPGSLSFERNASGGSSSWLQTMSDAPVLPSRHVGRGPVPRSGQKVTAAFQGSAIASRLLSISEPGGTPSGCNSTKRSSDVLSVGCQQADTATILPAPKRRTVMSAGGIVMRQPHSLMTPAIGVAPFPATVIDTADVAPPLPEPRCVPPPLHDVTPLVCRGLAGPSRTPSFGPFAAGPHRFRYPYRRPSPGPSIASDAPCTSSGGMITAPTGCATVNRHGTNAGSRLAAPSGPPAQHGPYGYGLRPCTGGTLAAPPYTFSAAGCAAAESLSACQPPGGPPLSRHGGAALPADATAADLAASAAAAAAASAAGTGTATKPTRAPSVPPNPAASEADHVAPGAPPALPPPAAAAPAPAQPPAGHGPVGIACADLLEKMRIAQELLLHRDRLSPELVHAVVQQLAVLCQSVRVEELVARLAASSGEAPAEAKAGEGSPPSASSGKELQPGAGQDEQPMPLPQPQSQPKRGNPESGGGDAGLAGTVVARADGWAREGSGPGSGSGSGAGSAPGSAEGSPAAQAVGAAAAACLLSPADSGSSAGSAGGEVAGTRPGEKAAAAPPQPGRGRVRLGGRVPEADVDGQRARHEEAVPLPSTQGRQWQQQHQHQQKLQEQHLQDSRDQPEGSTSSSSSSSHTAAIHSNAQGRNAAAAAAVAPGRPMAHHAGQGPDNRSPADCETAAADPAAPHGGTGTRRPLASSFATCCPSLITPFAEDVLAAALPVSAAAAAAPSVQQHPEPEPPRQHPHHEQQQQQQLLQHLLLLQRQPSLLGAGPSPAQLSAHDSLELNNNATGLLAAMASGQLGAMGSGPPRLATVDSGRHLNALGPMCSGPYLDSAGPVGCDRLRGGASDGGAEPTQHGRSIASRGGTGLKRPPGHPDAGYDHQLSRQGLGRRVFRGPAEEVEVARNGRDQAWAAGAADGEAYQPMQPPPPPAVSAHQHPHLELSTPQQVLELQQQEHAPPQPRARRSSASCYTNTSSAEAATTAALIAKLTGRARRDDASAAAGTATAATRVRQPHPAEQAAAQESRARATGRALPHDCESGGAHQPHSHPHAPTQQHRPAAGSGSGGGGGAVPGRPTALEALLRLMVGPAAAAAADGVGTAAADGGGSHGGFRLPFLPEQEAAAVHAQQQPPPPSRAPFRAGPHPFARHQPMQQAPAAPPGPAPMRPQVRQSEGPRAADDAAAATALLQRQLTAVLLGARVAGHACAGAGAAEGHLEREGAAGAEEVSRAVPAPMPMLMPMLPPGQPGRLRPVPGHGAVARAEESECDMLLGAARGVAEGFVAAAHGVRGGGLAGFGGAGPALPPPHRPMDAAAGAGVGADDCRRAAADGRVAGEAEAAAAAVAALAAAMRAQQEAAAVLAPGGLPFVGPWMGPGGGVQGLLAACDGREVAGARRGKAAAEWRPKSCQVPAPRR